MESIALRAAMLMPILLLQKPHARSKTKEHIKCLERRLTLWKSADIDALIREGRIIQSQFRKSTAKRNCNEEQRITQQFSKLMMQGKVKAAIRLLDNENNGGTLPLYNIIQSGNAQHTATTTVRDILSDKHPPGQPAHPDTIIPPLSPIQQPHPTLFDRLDGEMIRSVALQSEGSPGPSELDSHGWRRLCTAFRRASS